ncbi:hypothetical protein Bhyg_04088 [Pseudolycoriella hygida]|uniref:Uncharacterized protein n=1 Tax=Pseudolycoriella hygida TaxID=35572 RepID=A0A9Q0NG19_9DIPT|nr:hypothetical protein Bhyg_04088 [Pseudolycoriella hygida]
MGVRFNESLLIHAIPYHDQMTGKCCLSIQTFQPGARYIESTLIQFITYVCKASLEAFQPYDFISSVSINSEQTSRVNSFLVIACHFCYKARQVGPSFDLN